MDSLWITTPLGDLTLFADGAALVAVAWGRGADTPRTTGSDPLNRAADMLRSYFRDGRPDFNALNRDVGGTAFQRRVWTELRAIPYGETRTYGQLAQKLGTSPRAVGMACGANPLAIIVPCHRVVSRSGPGGYTGGHGVDTKTALLRLEGRA
ncbi:MAG: methylated-DNA--[protein]-cysteine S-methyltransferase [Alphaproteobacteria bacterium]|nr:methylated-DNA--[protein]-cysteine S-methyltransferase [Alphaproteobacteria bacterium]